MIVRNKPSGLDLLFAMRGSVLPHIARPLLALILLAVATTAVETAFHPLPEVDAAPFTVFGIALSLFLGFRNNAAYDRWWEARRLWGGLLADLRAFAREAQVFVPDEALRREMLETALAFLHLHRAGLRRQEHDPEMREQAADLLEAAHPPDAALDRLGQLVAQALAQGRSTASARAR